MLEGAGVTALALVLLSLCGCAALGGKVNRQGLSEANFLLSNGWEVGVEGFVKNAADQSGQCAKGKSHATPVGHLLSDSLDLDSCGESNFDIPAGFVEAVELAGQNCRYGDNKAYTCTASMIDSDSGDVLAQHSYSGTGWYSVPAVIRFPVYRTISGHLTVRIEMHSESEHTHFDSADYPAGTAQASATISSSDGTLLRVNATFSDPSKNSPAQLGKVRNVNGIWTANVSAAENAAAGFYFAPASWPGVTISQVSSYDLNPYEVSIVLEDSASGAILAYENYKAVGAVIRPAATFKLQDRTSGHYVLSVYVWETHSFNEGMPPAQGR